MFSLKMKEKVEIKHEEEGVKGRDPGLRCKLTFSLGAR